MVQKQLAVVQAFGSASRESNRILEQYLTQSLQVHMLEAVGSRPLTDKQCAEWLDANDETGHVFSVTAAEVIGRTRLLQMATQLKEDGQKYLAARRYIVMTATSE